LQANNLEISNGKYNENSNLLSFDIQWQNSWFLSSDSYDAAWVFAKYAPRRITIKNQTNLLLNFAPIRN